MKRRPFLTSFAIPRNSSIKADFISFYDESLDMNVFSLGDQTNVPSRHGSEYLSTMTKTSDEPEQADSDKGIDLPSKIGTDQQIFLGTQTLTEVANERADSDAHDDYLTFMATHTATKTTGENQDADF